MSRTQLNISIDPVLLKALKKAAIRSGKTLSNHLTEIISASISNENNNVQPTRIQVLEEKVIALEKKFSILTSNNHKITPFTEEESKKWSEFTREVFYRKIEQEEHITRKEAFEELVSQISCFNQWNTIYTLRLKEILFLDDYNPFSAKELNFLTLGNECPSPIRTGLINWITGNNSRECSCINRDFPTQQEICLRGSVLAKDIFRTLAT